MDIKETEIHQGVGIIIKNKSDTLFLIQEKDETYPIPQYRNCYSLFGGRIEDEETVFEGLMRELNEELLLDDLLDQMNIHFIQKFQIKTKEKYFHFHLFEGILDDDLFQKLSSIKCYEGYSHIIEKKELQNIQWVWGLEKVLKNYLQLI